MASRRNRGHGIIREVEIWLGCPNGLITSWHAGFTWRPAGMTQMVWLESRSPGTRSAGQRVLIRTLCLKRLIGTEEQQAALAREMPGNTISALVRSPGRLSHVELTAMVRIQPTNADWAPRLIAAAARLQVHDALRLAQSATILESGLLADAGIESEGPHPGALPDAVDVALFPDEADHVLPFESIAAHLRARPDVRAVATSDSLTASLPISSRTDPLRAVLLELRLGARPGLGMGLSVTLAMPARGYVINAMVLNEAEIRPDSPIDVLGGWVVRDGMLVHSAFVPRPLCTAFVIRLLADAAVQRARWLASGTLVGSGARWAASERGRILKFPGRA